LTSIPEKLQLPYLDLDRDTQKTKKPPSHTPTIPKTQPLAAPPHNLPSTPVTIPNTVPLTTINEVINVHQSKVDWQENRTFNAPNGHISGTIEATIEKSNIKYDIDDKEKELKPPHTETDGQLDLKPKVQTQFIPNTLGSLINDKPITDPQSQPKPMPTKSMWVRIPREKHNSPNDVLMIERKHKRIAEPNEDDQPIKKLSMPYEESPEAFPTAVAARQPHWQQ